MSEVTLSKTRSVLRLDQERAGNPPGGLFFKTDQDVEEGEPPRPVIQLAPEMWRDLGNPEEITIAIWPGDRQDLMEREDFPA